MSTTTVGALNRTLEETHLWLEDLARVGFFENEEQAYTGLRAVLHSLRDRLTIEEAVHLSAQLPMLVRGFYYEGWKPSLAPNREETAEEFYASVRESLRGARFTLDAEATVREVFALLERKLSEGQIRHVQAQLPAELRALW